MKQEFQRERIHANVDVKLLKKFPVRVISEMTGVSKEAIRAAIKNDGHVRKITKEKIDAVLSLLIKDSQYMTFVEAYHAGLITEEEREIAFRKIDGNYGIVSFEKWNAEKEPLFRKHNQAINTLEEVRIQSKRLQRKLEK